MEAAMRSFFLHLAQNRTLSNLAKRYGLRYGAQRFVAGETIDSAIETVRKMNQSGMAVTLDHLGEFVEDERDARASADFCLRTLEAIHNSGVNASLSVKMTQLGLDIREDLCKAHMVEILDYAARHDIWVNIDMEDFSHCQITLDLFREFAASYDKVQTVIQAYLYRSEKDVEELAQMGANIRIVKGAYKEPPTVAYPEKSDVDANYKRLLDIHLPSPGLTSIATHDEQMIDHAKQVIQQHGLSEGQYEFQMLYGIRTDLQEKLVREGYPVRIYVPYGDDWYGYFMRRLAERPANVGFVLRGILH
ncbi:proline dehydrogenase [Alicyclobacillus cycloheptanicus]|uniref:proline dehydrogenase n=1 Tax=Alicyclobacillus cycloheptanicus TaxID=1457 RepID=A0ABT9XG27_9BACL|nr:proline dehydrogenase [Alicyclobacillus cycloheptanicus]MDQ0189034.1 proline dehydrogenase [Alicyclobacillus cycloheptanicus]WDM00172.1 proline dehydrogenase [Alicyclobacillus cycloheptanicus]